MKKNRFVLLVMALALVIGMAAVGYAAEDDPSDDATGTVTKISGNVVTVNDISGKTVTLEVKDLKGLKTGDFVVISDFKVKKINPERKKGLDLK